MEERSSNNNNTAANGPPQYSEAHARYLTSRAIDLGIAFMAGVRSLVVAGVIELLSWTTAPCGGLSFPHPGPSGEVIDYLVRLDSPPEGMGEFVTANGGGACPYLPTPVVLEACGIAPDALDRPDIDLVVVERPTEALALWCHGILAIGLGGMGATGHDATRSQRDELDVLADIGKRLPLRDRPVTILFGANIACNADLPAIRL